MEPPPRSPSLQRGDSQELFFDLADRVIGRKVDNDPAAEMYDTMMNIPLIGDLSNAVEQGYSALKHVSMQKADEVIALQASKMISSIGATVLNSLHDHAMPRGVHDFVDESYGELWPEVKRSLLDSVMLDLGLEFRAMRANMHQHDAEPPKGWLKRAAARLIYAMEPYDLTIWGTIRSPLSLLIQLTFLFPFYGVSDICVILLAASKYFTNFNEYGLIQFIVTAKKLQFITSGLVSGCVAFTKLFICATLREDTSAADYMPSDFSCVNFYPGSHTTFPFEFFLFVVRSCLLWTAFIMLWNFDALVRGRRQTLRAYAAQQRLRAEERRGLFGMVATVGLVSGTWALALGVLALIGVDLAAQPQWWNEPFASWFDVLFIILVLQLWLNRALTHCYVTATPAKIGVALSATALPYLALRAQVGELLGASFAGAGGTAAAQLATTTAAAAANATSTEDIVSVDISLMLGPWLPAALVAVLADVARLAKLLAFLLSAASVAVALGLVHLQQQALAKDDAAVESLQRLMLALDVDGDGSVSKSELRAKYYAYFVSPYEQKPKSKRASLIPSIAIPVPFGINDDGDENAGVDQPRGRRASVSGGAGFAPGVHFQSHGTRPMPLSRRSIEQDGAHTFDAFWAQLDKNHDGRVTMEELAEHYGVLHMISADQARDKAECLDSEYIEKRLNELNEKQKADASMVQGRPGGALIWFVLWDVFAFVVGWVVTTPFLISEIEGAGITKVDQALHDWRLRCALYFCKVVIALMSFPFLIFALPLVQDWVTHVKPTGYDPAGNCVPKLSAAQIKAKFRLQHWLRKRKQEDGSCAPGPCCGCCGDDWWDQLLGIDLNYGLNLIEDDEADSAEGEHKRTSAVVDAARKARMKQLRKERLPEATLMPIEHSKDPRLEGKLQISGDPSSMFMML